MFKYELIVEGLSIGGHPHGELYMFLNIAAVRYDELCKQHPHKKIVFYEIEKKVLKTHQIPVPAPTQCAQGHSGQTDGKSVLRQGSSGNWICTVCGDIVTSPEQSPNPSRP